MHFLQLFVSQVGCMGTGFEMKQNHFSDLKFMSFLPICTFCFIQLLAFVGSTLENVLNGTNVSLTQICSRVADVECVFNFESSFQKLSVPAIHTGFFLKENFPNYTWSLRKIPVSLTLSFLRNLIIMHYANVGMNLLLTHHYTD